MTFNDPRLNQKLREAEKTFVSEGKLKSKRQKVQKKEDYKDYHFTKDNPNPNWY